MFSSKFKNLLIMSLVILVFFGIYLIVDDYRYPYIIKNKEIIAKEMIEIYTNQMINEAIILENSIDTDKGEASASLNETIFQRKTYILSLMQSNPKLFLESAMSTELKNVLFEDTVGIEKKITVEGEVEVLCAVDDAGEVIYEAIQLTTEDNEIYQVYLADEELDTLTSGDVVSITGYELDYNLVPDTLSSSDNLEVVVAAAPIENATHNKVAVILINFDKGTPATRSKDQWITEMTKYKDWMEEVSFNQVTLSGKNHDVIDIYGYYTIPAGNTECDYNTWRTKAKDAASKDGFNASGYRHVMYALASTSSAGVACGWGGLGTVGGVDTWYNNQYGGTIIHELGHNLGLRHARTATCTEGSNKVQISNNCTYVEYGDLYDVMGTSSNGRHYMALHKYYIGWIKQNNVRTISNDGIYDLYPLEYEINGTQLLHIPVTYRTNTGTISTFNYYLDFRKISKYDNYAVGSSPVRGVMVRTGTKGGYSDLYNANPTSSSFNTAALQIGNIFIDPIRKIEFKVLTADDNKATVEVKFNEILTCIKRDPTISVSPLTSSVKPGTQVTYTVSITNNDDKDICTASTFSVRSDISTGFTIDKTTSSVSIAPGQTSRITFNIKSPNTSTDEIYPLAFTVTELARGYSKILDASYSVTGSTPSTRCIRSNPTVSIDPTTGTNQPGKPITYNISIKNNDVEDCGASTFNISTKLPNGTWSIDANNINLTIAPGKTETKTVNVTSKSNEKNGNNTIPFTIKNNNSGSSTNASVIAVVDNKYNGNTGGGTTPVCTKVNPIVSVVPTSQNGEAGKGLTYTVTVMNNDSSICPNNSYTVTPNLPNGFTFNNSSTSLTIAPGKSDNAVFIVTPNSSVANGSYSIVFSAKEGNNIVNTTATYNVLNMSITPPVINISGITNNQTIPNGNNKVTIGATHSSGIGTIKVYMNDSLVQTCTNKTSCDYSIQGNKLSSGTHILKVEALANDNNKTFNSKIITFVR